MQHISEVKVHGFLKVILLRICNIPPAPTIIHLWLHSIQRTKISKKIGVSGDHLTDASPTVDQYNEPVVSLRFDSSGSRKFGDLTTNNVGKRFAIILPHSSNKS